MKAADWIDRAKQAQGWESDYRAAKGLQLSRQAISEYRSRSATMDDDVSLRVAQACGVDPAVILADQAMERARTDSARSAWAAVLQRLGGVAAGALLAVGVGSAPAPAQAAQLDSSGRPVCITLTPKRTRRRGALQAMADALRSSPCAMPAFA